MTHASPGYCPLCLDTRVQPVRGPIPVGGWSCPSCQLIGTEEAQRQRPLPHALLARFSAPCLTVANPHGWRARLGLARAETLTVDGFALPPATAIRLVEAADSRLTALGRPAFLRLDRTARLRLETEPAPRPAVLDQLTVGAICRPSDVAAIAGLVDACRGLTERFAFLLDSPEEADAESFLKALPQDIRATVRVHPLNRQFGAQRTRLQALASTEWVLQVDSDERPSAGMITGVATAIRHADLAGFDSMGFARANYVDGTLRALWPDVQFRLNRRSVRFKDDVHESPDVAWWRQSWCMTGHILHVMAAHRLPDRQEAYEAIATGGGRPQDRAFLETPFRPPYANDPLASLRPTLLAPA